MQTSVCLLRSLPLSGQFAAYYRVSTDRQGRSGLGLEAQQAAVRAYLGASTPIAEFTEVETGKRNDRPELERALALCRKRKARLVIAKLDRLSRNLAFIAALMDSRVEFVAVDNPHATRLTLHILAAVAEHEREMIAERTKAALQAAKARGVRLGRNGADRLAPAYRAQALARAHQLSPVLAELQRAGMSARRMAAELTARGILTPTGARWHAQTILRIIGRAGLISDLHGDKRDTSMLDPIHMRVRSA
jgi:DNA invertase Pin-like site-specific DNA recombinase